MLVHEVVRSTVTNLARESAVFSKHQVYMPCVQRQMTDSYLLRISVARLNFSSDLHLLFVYCVTLVFH